LICKEKETVGKGQAAEDVRVRSKGLIGKKEKVFLGKHIFSGGIETPDQLAHTIPINKDEVESVIQQFPMRITPYYLRLIRAPFDPIWRQVVPDIQEIKDVAGDPDPLCEDSQSPVPNLIHRYTDRVVFLVSGRCAVYCRFCMRKRRTGHSFMVNQETIGAGMAYIRDNRSIREVILSGGDPLMLDNKDLYSILHQLHAVSHVESLRIHTRIPCVFPQRVTNDLVKMMKRFHPIYINIHFNHPNEITLEAARACTRMADAGIPLGSQTVLLKGVNDDVQTITRLMRKLLSIRVRPYYLHQTDPVCGTRHFHTPLEKGLEIISGLRGRVPGLGVPDFMIDLPGGGGKVELLPGSLERKAQRNLRFRNYDGQVFDYPAD